MRTRLIIICAAALCLFGHSSAAQTSFVFEDSPALHCNDTVLVYSPYGDRLKRNLPTVFLLHGYSGSPHDWEDNLDIQGLSDRYGFRIICPDGFYDSWYINKADTTSTQWRDFFWEELWPMMDNEYGLQPDRTFTDGLSMGGHGAVNLFLDHPELMRGAGSMSGVLNLRNAGGSSTLIPPMLGASDITDPLCDEQSAVNRISRVREICGPAATDKLFVITCGSIDSTFIPASREFEAKANEEDLRVIAIYSPARHRWPYWAWMLPYHLDFFRQAVDGEALGYTDK